MQRIGRGSAAGEGRGRPEPQFPCLQSVRTCPALPHPLRTGKVCPPHPRSSHRAGRGRGGVRGAGGRGGAGPAARAGGWAGGGTRGQARRAVRAAAERAARGPTGIT